MPLYAVPLFLVVPELTPGSPLGVTTLLYVGPDQILPLTSFLGAIAGIILIFWRYLVGLAPRIWRFLMRRS